MKIGTDGAMLGAWTKVEDMASARVLDLGTGTGLLALMLAQRNHALQIDAVELDEDAVGQARENAASSPFTTQIEVHHSDIQSWEPGYTYDLIVSNPPFYSGRVLSPDLKRTKARHDEFLPLDELVSAVDRLLATGGRFSIVWPFEREEELTSKLAQRGIHSMRRCRVAPRPDKSYHRVLKIFKKGEISGAVEEETMLIEQYGRAVFSASFIALLREYYLDF